MRTRSNHEGGVCPVGHVFELLLSLPLFLKLLLQTGLFLGLVFAYSITILCVVLIKITWFMVLIKDID